jgi:plasmid stabilization system protein ParE
MARIELAPEVMDDLDRFVDHMTSFGVADAERRIEELIAAIEVLTHSPQIGRPTRGDKRELVIGKGARGYVALYRYLIPIDTVFVLAVRSQRESGYKRRRSRS